MNIGFELISEAAKPKRAEQDAPLQQPMRPTKLRRNPDSDQKAIRRRLKQKTAVGPVEDLGTVKYDIERMPGGTFPAATLAQRVVSDIAAMKNNTKLHIVINGVSFLVYYDEDDAYGDDGSPVSGDVTGDYEAYVEGTGGTNNIIRQHVSPSGSSGYGNPRAKSYAAEQVAKAICDSADRHTASKESNVNYNQREAELLSAMGKATLAEQKVLAAELEEMRSERAAGLQADRDTDIANGVIRDHLTPVLTHSLNTTATDWLDEVADDDGGIDATGAQRQARVEAGQWFERTSSEVRADRDEFAEQAMGKARVVASGYGSAAGVAERAFLDTVAFLHKRNAAHIPAFSEDEVPPVIPRVPHTEESLDFAQKHRAGYTDGRDSVGRGNSSIDAYLDVPRGGSAVVVDPLPDSTPGPQNDQTAPWTEQDTTGDSNTDASSQKEVTAAGDSPGKVDQDQSGNAESTITDYNTMGEDPESFDEKQTGPLTPTGPYAVPSTRAPNVTGMSLAEAREAKEQFKAELGEVTAADPQSGNAVSHDKEVAVGNPNDRPMWPWEMAELPEGTDGSASNVGGVATPGKNVADYPQPKSSVLDAEAGGLDNLGDKKAPPFGAKDDEEKKEPTSYPREQFDMGAEGALNVQAGYPLCAAGCNHTLSAADQLVNTDHGLAHAACLERTAAGTPMVQAGPSLKPGETGTLTTEGALVAEGEYHYVHKRGDEWVITQKGTGKVLSTHDSEEKAKASFRAMMESKHGGSLQDLPGDVDTTKLAAFRERVAANVGGDAVPFVHDAALTDYKVGDRVELHPATDAWMFGDRYGEVAKVGREKVHVKMDRSGRTLRMHPDNIRGKID